MTKLRTYLLNTAYIFTVAIIGQPYILVAQVNDDLYNKDDTPLTVDEAYQLEAQVVGDKHYVLDFFITQDYYLYKSKFSFVSAQQGINLRPNFSDNDEFLADRFFGEQDVYRNYAQVTFDTEVPLEELLVSYQGCWDKGLCYPVETRKIKFVAGDNLGEITYVDTAEQDLVLNDAGNNLISSGGYQYYLNSLRSASWFYVLLLFFVAGLALTFTPCVLPMLPILSGIITGQNNPKLEDATKSEDSWASLKARLSLASTYLATMSLTFSALGFFSGVIGYGLRELLGSQFFLLIMATLVTALATSMLNIYSLHLPRFINNPLQRLLSAGGSRGSYPKVIIWGFLSPFVVGTCLSAPLAAAMVYLAEQGNPWFGALSLLVLAWGMGLPLLLFVLGLGQILPSGGPWLSWMQMLFGMMLFALAVFIISPLIPAVLEQLAYVLLLMILIYKLLARYFSFRRLAMTFMPLCLTVLLYLFVVQGQYNTGYNNQNQAPEEEVFSQTVNTYAGLLQALDMSKQQATPLVIYYYADWCISCRELEWVVFRDKQVKAILSQAASPISFIKLDITKAGQESRSLAEHFNVIGPPTLIFINSRGDIIQEFSLIGNFPKAAFVERLESLR